MDIEEKFKQQFGDPEDVDVTEVQDRTADAFGSNLDLPVKPGAYLVEVMPDHTENTQTSTGGEMMKVQTRIVDGQKYANRHMFFQFNHDNKNEEVAKRDWKQLIALAQAIGSEALPPTAENLAGGQFIARTGLEKNEYKGEITYEPTLWGVRPPEDGPAEGPFDDADQPDIWQEAVEHAKSKNGGSDSDDGASSDGPTESFSESDMPF